MTTTTRIAASAFALVLCLAPRLVAAAVADADPFAAVRTRADLDGLVAATDDVALKQAIRDHAAAILAAAEQRPHVEAVVRTVESAPGKVERVNATPEGLRRAVGRDVALFDTLRAVDLAVPAAGAHDRRTVDPYDAAFFDHLGHVAALESLNVASTKAADDWIAPIGRLTNLKTLRFTNNGKLTDAGLAHLAGLKQLEVFGFVGTGMKGHALTRFDGWTALRHAAFRGSSIDDEGLAALCERFPNLENLGLAHAKFTDAAAGHLAKLTKLKGLEVGSRNATPKCLRHLAGLPLAYLQLGDGLDAAEGVALIRGIGSLRRLTLTNGKPMTDADLNAVAGMTQLEAAEINNLDLPDERLSQLQAFGFLKTLRLVRRPEPYPPQTQAKIKALLPRTAVTFE